jgi:hypothetical protein
MIRVRPDNLNMHGPALLSEAFPPEEARRLTERSDFHHTPKHVHQQHRRVGLIQRGGG